MGSAAAAGTATGPARQAEFSRHQGQVGLRGGQVQLEFRLGASEVTRLADDQMASRANRCSTTTRRARYSSYPALCCNARACCRRASWGWISTHRPVLPLDEMHWDRSGQVIHSDPSNWKACKRWTRPAPSVRFPAGTMVWVTCPAGQVQLPAARSMTRSSLGKRCRSGRPGTRATSLRPASAKAWRVPPWP